ncbi:hypothetical protein D9M70_578450 [compost metagenome]
MRPFLGAASPAPASPSEDALAAAFFGLDFGAGSAPTSSLSSAFFGFVAFIAGRETSAFGLIGVVSGTASSSKPLVPSALVPIVTLTTPPFFSLPKRISSASGFLMFSWMTRASGRAPIFSS